MAAGEDEIMKPRDAYAWKLHCEPVAEKRNHRHKIKSEAVEEIMTLCGCLDARHMNRSKQGW